VTKYVPSSEPPVAGRKQS